MNNIPPDHIIEFLWFCTTCGLDGKCGKMTFAEDPITDEDLAAIAELVVHQHRQNTDCTGAPEIVSEKER